MYARVTYPSDGTLVVLHEIETWSVVGLGVNAVMVMLGVAVVVAEVLVLLPVITVLAASVKRGVTR